MSLVGRLVRWFFKLLVFFTLFAFALNNLQDSSIHFFFGYQWRSPQVLIVLVVFCVGVAVGVLGMMPWWWKQRCQAVRSVTLPPQELTPGSTSCYTDGA